MDRAETAWVLAPDVAFVETDAETYVLALRSTVRVQVPMVVEGTGRYLWELLRRGPVTLEDLVGQASEDFAVPDPDVLRTQVETFLTALAERGVVVRPQSGDGPDHTAGANDRPAAIAEPPDRSLTGR